MTICSKTWQSVALFLVSMHMAGHAIGHQGRGTTARPLGGASAL